MDAPVIISAPTGPVGPYDMAEVQFEQITPDGYDLVSSWDAWDSYQSWGLTDIADLSGQFPGPGQYDIAFAYKADIDDTRGDEAILTIQVLDDADTGGGDPGDGGNPGGGVDDGIIGYATIVQARAAGAIGDDATVARAMGTATDLIHAYTGQAFAAADGQVAAYVDSDGVAAMPVRIIEITGVSWTDTGESVSAATDGAPGYRFTSSAVLGMRDEVILPNRGRGFNMLIMGAEPWRGGYANLYGEGYRRQVLVSGRFGWVTPPPAAIDAQLALTVALTTGQLAAGVQAIAVEGYSVTYAPGATQGDTTGSPLVDRMLAPHRKAGSGLVIL